MRLPCSRGTGQTNGGFVSTPARQANYSEESVAAFSDLSGPTCKIESPMTRDRKSTRLNSSHVSISYAVFCLKKKKTVKSKRYRVCADGGQLVLCCRDPIGPGAQAAGQHSRVRRARLEIGPPVRQLPATARHH